MTKIVKQVGVILTQEEIDSPDPIEIKLHVHKVTDPGNKDGVTYTITYPKES